LLSPLEKAFLAPFINLLASFRWGKFLPRNAGSARSARLFQPLHYQEHDLEQELDLVAVTRRQMARTLKLTPHDRYFSLSSTASQARA
jgi:hypothetical protein